MLSSNWGDALAHNMEIETWTPTEVKQAFSIGEEKHRIIEDKWRMSWERLGARLRCLLNEELDSLPEDTRRELEKSIEQ